MKKLVSLFLALLLALTALAIPAMAEEPVVKAGVLTMLNMTEAEMVNFIDAQALVVEQLDKDNYAESILVSSGDAKPALEVVFYDSLDAMLMALNAGDIDMMFVYAATAEYLIANNDALVLNLTLPESEEEVDFVEFVYYGLLSNDFAFMMMEDNAELCDEFSKAIQELHAEPGEVMHQLVEDHIYAPIYSDEIKPVEMPAIDGAETIRVAVTGALPPMDYVAPDGSPAGFNTAILAEISKRIGKNVELVVVDSIGRAAALASGTVDVVFWTRTNSLSNYVAQLDEENAAEYCREVEEELTQEQIETMHKVEALIDIGDLGISDMPEGTIISDGYVSDIIVPVMLRERLEKIQESK